MSSYDPSQPPLITETLLKKRRSLEELAIIRSETVQKQVKRRRVIRGESIKVLRPEQLAKANRIKDGSLKKVERQKKQASFKLKSMMKTGSTFLPTIGFVVRVREAKSASKAIKKELQSLGLEQIYSAIFFKLDSQTILRLKPLDSYLAYGYITLKSVEELVHRRAYSNIDGIKKPLNNNITVENILGDKNILCLNDLVHEIYNVGENYSSALNVLAPFDLAAPIGNFEKKILQVHSDECGFMGEKMDEFLTRIL